jgi:hypothetical protein
MKRKTPILTRPLRHAAIVLALLAGAASAQTADAPDALQAFDAAIAAYERNHWDEAFAALVRLADRGHPEAARMALQMWRFGPKLYQTNFSASAVQVERWTQLWGCGGDATSRACQLALQAR